MGMWVVDGHSRFYKEDGKLYSGPNKKIEYDVETFLPLEKKEKPVTPDEPEHETVPIVLGATRQELEAMSYTDILKALKIRPQKGMTKAALINEILGASE